ncbi:threonine aldolase family protein [Desertimonas flava]|uniref:threonine aldolase family protein n=1 Tax=Desertimonas flava TaxID=2064846 RepID=UPI000E35091B|nr:beta-eliminating lyase-related protein [Desertimonas flava]
MTTPSPIELRSDNAAGAHPRIIEAIAAANVGSALAYGDDEWTADLHRVVRDVFEHDTARVFPVVSGTAANSLALSAMCPPWGAVLCHESAHIVENECGATSLFGGGAVMRTVPGDDYRIQPATLDETFAATRWGDSHASQPKVLSLTLPTDHGTLYQLDELTSLTKRARERGLRVHVDGARLANAVAALDCRPAELTWRAGVDAVSLGTIKNGGVSADAIVSFDDAVSNELYYRLKRAGHVSSKMRFQSAQVIAYLEGDAWVETAAHANAAMARLAAGLEQLGAELLNRPDVNMLFLRCDDATADRLEAAGLLFYRLSPGVIRFVTSFQTSDANVDEALARVERAL